MVKKTWDILQKLNSNSFDSDFAILILNQPIICDSNLISNLWNKASLRGVVDGGSNRWLDFIQKHPNGTNLPLPDFISGDFDSILPNTKSYFESKSVTFFNTPDQDATDFTKGLHIVGKEIKSRKLNVKLIVTICENSGRFDQIMANVNTLLCSINKFPNLVLLSSECITWVLSSGEHVILVPEIYKNKKYNCGLIPICGPTSMTTSGLKWNLKESICEFKKLVSSSNTFAATEVHIVCNKDMLWTTEY